MNHTDRLIWRFEDSFHRPSAIIAVAIAGLAGLAWLASRSRGDLHVVERDWRGRCRIPSVAAPLLQEVRIAAHELIKQRNSERGVAVTRAKDHPLGDELAARRS
jgi:hypothetical protein